MIRALILMLILGFSNSARAACLPLAQGQRVITDMQAGRLLAARFQGDNVRRAIDRLVPGGGAEYDLLYLIPRPDGSAGIILGSMRRQEMCMTDPLASANAAQVVDALGAMQRGR